MRTVKQIVVKNMSGIKISTSCQTRTVLNEPRNARSFFVFLPPITGSIIAQNPPRNRPFRELDAIYFSSSLLDFSYYQKDYL